ncbi:MAG: hypothetical protein RhofKO_33280 [Rhodothermales bacterium]
MKTPNRRRLTRLLTQFKARWQRRVVVQGLAVAALVAIVALLGYAIGVLAVEGFRAVLLPWLIVSALLVVGVLVRMVWLPLRQAPEDPQIALFIEEQKPELQDRLISAVEANEAVSASTIPSELFDQLMLQANQYLGATTGDVFVTRLRERLLTGVAVLAGVLLLVFVGTNRGVLFGDGEVTPLIRLASAEVPFMTIEPGNIEVEQGATQEVVVRFRDVQDGDVELVAQDADGQWQRWPMLKGRGGDVFVHSFEAIQSSFQYRVEIGEVRSDIFTVEVAVYPAVAQIDVTYRYPAYTGLPTRTEENFGDIEGLKGSRVRVVAQTMGEATTAQMAFESGRILDLTATGNGTFETTFVLDEPDTYEIRLTNTEERANPFPETYFVTPIDDAAPFLRVEEPGRDVHANAIEEVLIVASASDDFGVESLDLHYSINDQDEQTVALFAEQTRPTEVDGEHLFFLEDYSLEPGDVITYYVSAADVPRADGPIVSDLFFIKVLPFDLTVEQVNNMGGAGGGGQSSAIVMNQVQILSAIWNLLREQKDLDEEEVEESTEGVIQAQETLRREISDRINSTAFSMELRMSEENLQIVDALRESVGAMDEALGELRDGDLRGSLKPGRRALNYLEKADAVNREKQVARQQPGQGGGGGGSSMEERMTELMDLELDTAKDKYETQQQQPSGGQQSEQDDANAELLRRVQELARRQESLANQNQQAQTEEEQRRFIDRLQREQDELNEQTQQLSQQMRQQAQQQGSSQAARQRQQQMERVTRNMREAERALREDDQQTARARQQQALNDLQRLERDLGTRQQGSMREQIQDVAEQFDQLEQQQDDMQRSLDTARREAEASGNGMPSVERQQELERQAESARAMLEALKQDVETARQQREDEDATVGRALRRVEQELERQQLDPNLRRTQEALEQGWIEQAARSQENVQAGLDRVRRDMDDLRRQLPMGRGEQAEQNMEAMREIMRQVDALRADVGQEGQQPQGESQQGQNPNGQPGQQQGQQQGEQSGQGQPGQAQPQSGQPGQGGRATAARQQQQLESLRRDFQELARDMEGQGRAGELARNAVRALNRADGTGVLLGEDAEAFFQSTVYDILRELEAELQREMDALALEQRLYGTRRADVPEAYRGLTEQYYEALSRTRNNR